MYSLQKSLNFGQYIPNDKVLNKKVPENPRYKHVKPAIDTGKNVKRHIDELKEKQKNLNHKKDEVFNRIKFSAFIKLAIYVAKEQWEERDSESKEAAIKNDNVVHKTNSKLANVLIGIGEIDLRNEKLKPPEASPKIEKIVPYLLLDVRDKDEFLKFHIKTAKHYPAAMLSRSNCYELEEMKLYKNSRPELIILYDEDESIAPRVATTLVQRGYENIYVLSGGLKLGHDIFPRALMVAISTSDSNASSLGPSATVQFKSASNEYFTLEDIENIQQYIEDCPRNSINPSYSSKSYTTHSKSGKASLSISKSAENYIPKHGSVTYRKGSATSLKSAEPVRPRVDFSSRSTVQTRLGLTSRGATAEGHPKPVKKVPWK